MFNTFHSAILGLLILPLFAQFSSANLEQKMVTINDSDKQVTLTLFHFNTANTKASIIPVVKNIGSTMTKMKGISAVTIGESAGLIITDGVISFSDKAEHLMKEGTAVHQQEDSYGKHTFILTNGKGTFTLGYAPLLSKSQLVFALQQYVKSNKFNLSTAVLLSTGHDAAFYKDNAGYHAYYLKELNPAKQILMVK